MESVNEIKEALSARSRTATLDELKSEGRKRVRLIRAEHVASMITEAVHAAIEQSGLVAPEEVEKLVEKSRQEFRSILKEREQELQKAQENEQALAEKDEELEALKARIAQLEAGGTPTTVGRTAAGVAASGGGAMSNELVMSLVQEMATMKANLMTQQGGKGGAAAAAAAAGGGGDFTAALEKLAGSLNDKFEKLGKKMGISAAVDDSTPMDFGALFKDVGGKPIESNMDNIEVKQKAGGGIAANLARLKKLKGGG